MFKKFYGYWHDVCVVKNIRWRHRMYAQHLSYRNVCYGSAECEAYMFESFVEPCGLLVSTTLIFIHRASANNLSSREHRGNYI